MMPQIVAPVRMRRAVSAVIETLEDRRLLSATISLQNLDGLPTDNRLVFNRIQNPNPDVNDIVHDMDTLAITNSGDQPLTIKSLSLSDTTNWQLVSPPAAGTVVAVGHTLDVTVKFIAQSAPANQPVDETNDLTSTDGLAPAQTGGVWDGTLTINSNDPATPASTVQLAGYWQYESEHEEEPNLQTIVNRLFGYGTDISSTQQPDYANSGSTVVPYGEEVLSGLWQAANPSQAVTVRELAAYHTQDDPFNTSTLLSQHFNWYSQASPSNTHLLFEHALREGQSLLPNILNSTTAPAEGSFSPGGVFGLNIDGEYSQDSLNTTDINTYGRSGHAIRFYPARDSSGNLMANTWIVALDYQNQSFDNSDYQDAVYLVTNMRPVTQAPAPASLSAASANGQVSLSWNAVSDSTLSGYNIYRSESASGPFTKLNSTPFNGTTYIDSAPPTATEYYQVSAVDTAGESEKSDAAVGVASSQGGSNGPDLTLGAVTGKFKSSVVGNTLSGPSKVTLTNSGNQTAKGTVVIELFASQSQTNVSGATEVSHITRNVNLKAGKSITFALPGFRYASTLNGQYFMVAQVQATKGIVESNTANNLGASTSATTITPPFVDLDNLFTGAPPATLVPGKRTLLTMPVLNKGNVTAHGVVTVTIAASTSSSGAGGTTLATLKLPVLLAAGKTAKYNLRFLVPTLAHGTYFVVTNVAIAGDTNAANNTAVSTGTFIA
jgi:hypothetical protein